MRAIAHELLRARVKNVALRNHRLVDDRLARDQLRDMLLARILAILAQHGRETIAIVKSNQPRGVVARSESQFRRDAELR